MSNSKRRSYRTMSENDNSFISTDNIPKKSKTFILGNESTEQSISITEINNSMNLRESSLKELKSSLRKIVNRNKPILGVTGDKYFEEPLLFSGEVGMVNVRRPVYSQNKFNELFEENISERQNMRFFDNIFMISSQKKDYVEIILSIFPLVNVIKNYNFKKSLPFDILSGITTGIMRIPQSMAYAILAFLPPVFGLYTAFFSAILYPVFGGSHHMAAGAQGVVSLIVGDGVSKYLERPRFENISTFISNSSDNNNNLFLEYRIDIGITITFMTGIIQCLLGIFRFGFVTNYLSDPLIGGFTTAAAITVVVSQLPVMLGIKVKKFSGVLNMWYLLFDIFSKILYINYVTFSITLFCFILLTLSKYLSFRFQKKMKIPIPGELIVMIILILFSYFLEIDKRWNVHLVGNINQGFPSLRLPNPKYMLTTIEVSVSAAIVSFALGYSIAKRLALLNDYGINGNREVFAFGFMNSCGSFFNCFAATASMSASALHESLGGVSQIANIFASILLLLAILFMGNLFEPVPECVLSTVILINLKSILFQIGDLKMLWKISKFDFMLWLVTFLAVVILDIDIGLALGVVFSLMTIVFRTQWPYSCLLGRIPSTDIYKNISLTPDAEEIPGMKIFRFEGSLYFASADHFTEAIKRITGINPGKINKIHKEREKKLIQVKEQAIHLLDRDNYNSGSTLHLIDNSIIDLNCQDVHHIIVDFSTCSFIDSVGVRTLMQVIHDYKGAQINVFLANVRAAVRAIIINTNILYKCISSKHIFLSVHDAVLGALEDERFITERNFIIKDAAIKSGTHCVSRIESNPNLAS